MKKLENAIKKLEKYEQDAYEGGVGLDWLEMIGEELLLYLKECRKNKIEANLDDFLKEIDNKAENFFA